MAATSSRRMRGLRRRRGDYAAGDSSPLLAVGAGGAATGPGGVAGDQLPQPHGVIVVAGGCWTVPPVHGAFGDVQVIGEPARGEALPPTPRPRPLTRGAASRYRPDGEQGRRGQPETRLAPAEPSSFGPVARG